MLSSTPISVRALLDSKGGNAARADCKSRPTSIAQRSDQLLSKHFSLIVYCSNNVLCSARRKCGMGSHEPRKDERRRRLCGTCTLLSSRVMFTFLHALCMQ
ncbi:unnamed protein product [Cercospora beticola]|nr:unnamed protein product [Cercospora beticola]